jgi:hypothetical protein
MDVSLCNEDARFVAESTLWVNAASIDRVLALEAQMRDRAIAQNSNYTRMAAEAVRASQAGIGPDNPSSAKGLEE